MLLQAPRITIMACALWMMSFSPNALAHGFTADTVDIKRLMNGRYRVHVWYTHLQIGEYRKAHIDFVSKEEALEAFRKLTQGAEFFLGDAKNIHFHEEEPKLTPY